MAEGRVGNKLITYQYVRLVRVAIFIVSMLLVGVTLSALLWRTEARLQALEEAMRLQVDSLNDFRLTGKTEPRPLVLSRNAISALV